MHSITSHDELRRLLGDPLPRAKAKDRPRLGALDRQWLAASPFCLIGTADGDGNGDVSPKGDPPGFIHVLDDSTIVIPERPGNRRVDGFHNLIDNPHVGIISIIPGRGDSLRINGTAEIIVDAPYFDDLVVKGHRPLLAMVVTVEQVFYHCSKAFLRSQLWNPSTWNPDAAPSRARIAHALERPDDTIEELEAYYGAAYAEGIYR